MSHPTSLAPAMEAGATTTTTTATATTFTVGQWVNVQARTWPGMNQPGGVGRITAIHQEASDTAAAATTTTVSVKYVLDSRHEKHIPIQYVKPMTITTNPLRDRRLLLGRCRRCGSLRRDCGSCDADDYAPRDDPRHPRRKNDLDSDSLSLSSSSSSSSISSSSVDDMDAHLLQLQRKFQKYQRLKLRAQKILARAGVESSSSEEEENESTTGNEDQRILRRRRKPQQQQQHQPNLPPSVLIMASADDEESDREEDGFSSTASTSENEDDDRELEQLAHLSSQVEFQPPLSQGCRTRARLRRLAGTSSRGHRHVVRPTSNSSGNQTATIHQPQSRRRRRASPGVAPVGILEATAAATADSDSDSNNNNIAATTTSNKKMGTTTAHSIDGDIIGEIDEDSQSSDFNQAGVESIDSPNGADNTFCAANDPDEDDDFPLGGDGFFDDDDDVPMNDSQPATELVCGDDDDNLFIQPEGNASQLPRDICDATATLDYPDLAPFFDQTADSLEHDELGLYKLKVVLLERDWKEYWEGSKQQQQQQPLPQPANRGRALQKASLELHDEIIRVLVRGRLDQCRNALRKLSSRRCYKKYIQQQRMEESSVVAETFVDQDVREFRFDALLQAVEDVVARLRYLCDSPLLSDDNEYVGGDDRGRFNGGSNTICDDVWADQSSQSPSHHPWGSQSQKDVEEQSADSSCQSPLDPHPFATKKRKPKSTLCDRNPEKSRRTVVDAVPKKRNGTNKGRFLAKFTTSDSAVIHHNRRRTQQQSTPTDRAEANSGSDTGSTSILDRLDNRQRNPTLVRERNKKRAANSTARSVLRDPGNRSKRSNASNIRRNVLAPFGGEPTNKDDTFTTDPASLSTAQEAPDIETILPAFLDGSGIAMDRASNQQGDQHCIGDRMQNWIDANSRQDAAEHPTYPSSLERRPRQEQTQHADLPSKVDPSYLETLNSARKEIYANLASRTPVQIAGIENIPSTERTLASLCISLNEPCSASTFTQTLNGICYKAVQTASQPTTNTDTPCLAFESLHSILCGHGAPTLQELVSCGSPLLDRHVAVLSALLRLIKHEVNKTLSSIDGILYEIFGHANSSHFVDFVLAQLVETTLSLVLPAAWGLRVKDPRRTFRKLEPLRDALALHCCLTERLCRCLGRDLGRQEWRCVRDGAHVFVASVAPSDWFSFISSGKKPSSPTEVRHKTIPNPFPRCEVEAIWFLLGYFGVPQSSIQNTESSRWLFVCGCMGQGSLFLASESETLPPCRKQMDAVAEDLTSLTHLIVTGAMGDLPRRDNVLLDLLRRAIRLHADDLFLSEESRMSDFPAIRDKTLDKNLSFEIWDGSWYLAEKDNLAMSLCSGDDECQWMGHPVLLPSSRILRCCLGLLIAWAERIPNEKPKRLQMFEKAVKTLVKQLSEDSGIETDQPELDAFQLAFSSQSSPNKGGNASERRSLFRRESAAYLTIYAESVVALKFNRTNDNEENSHLNTCLDRYRRWWILLADNAMIKRQEFVESKGESIRPAEHFRGDKYQLYVASKVMSKFAFVLYGESQSHGYSSSLDYRPSALLFLLSCLIACLDCSSDSMDQPEIMSCIAINIGMVLSQACRFPSAEDTFTKTILVMLSASSAVQRAFSNVTRASYCGSEEDLSLHALLAIIRRSVALHHERKRTAIDVALQVDNTEQDEFDDIDDALLASIDLGTTETMIQVKAPDPIAFFYDLLASALMDSKPSAQNAILQPSSLIQECSMSPQGMKLINKRSVLICRTLADIIASQGLFGNAMKKPWMLPNRFPLNDQGDSEHYQLIGKLLTQYLCSYRQSDHVVEVVRQNSLDLLLNLLGGLLDGKLLQKVPSCNLSRISLNSGWEAEEKGFSQLMSYKNGLPSSVCDAVRELHNCCGNLGRLLSVVDEISFGKPLLDFQDSRRDHPTLVDSVERECLSSFLLFRDLLNLCGHELSFQKISAHLLGTCARELARLIRKMGIQDQANDGSARQKFASAKLYETTSCFAEMFVSLMTVVFRSSGSNRSSEFTALVSNVLEKFIFPLLREQDIDLLASLNELTLQTSAVIVSQMPQCRPLHTAVSATALDMRPCCTLLRRCIVRRSREFLLLSAETNSHTILDAILSLGANGFAPLVSRSFSINAYTRETETEDGHFPLQIAMTEAFRREEQANGFSTTKHISLMKLKLYALEKVLIPKLYNSSANRCGVLDLVQHMLDRENEDRHTILKSAFVLCSLAKGIVTSIRHALQSSIVDEALVKACFQCARSLINMPAACADANAVGWLIDWARSSQTPQAIAGTPSHEAGDRSNEQQMSLHARYIWHICLWLKCLGDLLVEGKTNTVQCIRANLVDNVKKGLDGFAPWSQEGTSYGDTVDTLVELERQLFPVADGAVGKKIVNVYRRNQSAASNTILGDDPLVWWKPGAELRLAVAQFAAKVKSASCII